MSGFNLNILVVLAALFSSLSVAAPLSIKMASIELKPYGFIDKSGRKKGVLYELSDQIAKEINAKFTNTVVPYARAILQVKNGTSDLVLIFANDILESSAKNMGPVLELTNIILTKKNFPVSTLSDLKGKTIAHVTNANYDETYQKNKSIKKFYTQSYTHNFNLLSKDRVHGVVGPEIGLYYTAKEMGYEGDYFSKPLVLIRKNVVLYLSSKFHERHKEDAIKIRAVAQAMFKNGQSQRILDKYNPFLSKAGQPISAP